MNFSEKTLAHIELLKKALAAEYEHEKSEAVAQIKQIPLRVLQEQGKCWFPVMIKRVEYNKKEYVVVEIERPNETNQSHKFSTGEKSAFLANKMKTFILKELFLSRGSTH